MLSPSSNINSEEKNKKKESLLKRATANAQPEQDSSYADKFMERIIKMAIPTTTTSNPKELQRVTDRIQMQRSRPQLSMQIMSKNSILLLQRLSIPFELIDSIITIISWTDPLQTLCVLFTLTIIILKPINLITLPLFYVSFEIIIPAYLIKNPHLNDGSPYVKPRPVNEFSREFLLNVTDLQNHMLLYVVSWDFINEWCLKLFYFEDGILTWIIFVLLLSIGLLLENYGSNLIYYLLPIIKITLILFIWSFLIVLHPTMRKHAMDYFNIKVKVKTMNYLYQIEQYLTEYINFEQDQNKKNLVEIKQVEIFELQLFNKDAGWCPLCFTSDIYPTNSHFRSTNEAVDGVTSLAMIKPPPGWEWVEGESFEDNKKRKKRSKSKSEEEKPLIFGSSGWKVDMYPENWTSGAFESVLKVDTQSKWVYDSGSAPLMRRRRLLRGAARVSKRDCESDSEEE
ncbi:Pex29 protein [Martiniozyma asiatica (nom. inval.)]|nr:Pex29 protein [Martiniozyma asiatica]